MPTNLSSSRSPRAAAAHPTPTTSTPPVRRRPRATGKTAAAPTPAAAGRPATARSAHELLTVDGLGHASFRRHGRRPPHRPARADATEAIWRFFTEVVAPGLRAVVPDQRRVSRSISGRISAGIAPSSKVTLRVPPAARHAQLVLKPIGPAGLGSCAGTSSSAREQPLDLGCLAPRPGPPSPGSSAASPPRRRRCGRARFASSPPPADLAQVSRPTADHACATAPASAPPDP